MSKARALEILRREFGTAVRVSRWDPIAFVLVEEGPTIFGKAIPGTTAKGKHWRDAVAKARSLWAIK